MFRSYSRHRSSKPVTEIKTCCIKPEPSVASKQDRARQDPATRNRSADLRFGCWGKSTWVTHRKEFAFPTIRSFSQAGLRVDPNRPLTLSLHCAGSAGREINMSSPVGPLAKHTMHGLSPKKVRHTTLACIHIALKGTSTLSKAAL